MGRYTRSLAPLLVEAAGVGPGMKVLDVGCGPGGLTTEVAKRVGGAEHVAAIDPAPQFAAACGERHPGADVRVGVAEDLPWPDDSFDAALSSLVIAFMQDADKGVHEMMRVTRGGGVVAACMWDIVGGGMTMLHVFWEAARELDPDVQGERVRPKVRLKRRLHTMTSQTSGSRSPSQLVLPASTLRRCPRPTRNVSATHAASACHRAHST
jgi:SAM-dependent methyltransferase